MRFNNVRQKTISEEPDQTEYRICSACGGPITDKFLLEVSQSTWHTSCLRCCICQLLLDNEPSCFIRDQAIYCKADYAK
ncbi:hypothetical protein D910_02913 [Dendroctonus ponderosae]|uniref:LIM zinc-binding domain-containing protein n=1 Tax=Dendroctonus ponderosae TaxID=77166 RepID=U4TV97_DENPD|nr:hypothetical protein D910_02913 [Dendroctonus ponderosae]